jgi:hypothetical protein
MFPKEHRLTALQNRACRNILGPKREEVTREWRKWHNEKLHKLHSSSIIISYQITEEDKMNRGYGI